MADRASTNENSWELDIPLSFLKKGNYQALVIRDGIGSDCFTNHESYRTDMKKVAQTDILHVSLAPGGVPVF